MKRKLIILILALTTSLSVFSGLASLLATGPNPAETAPITIAEVRPNVKPPKLPKPPPPPLTPNGGSWGG